MSDQGASQTNSESGYSRLNSTSLDDELFVDNADLSFNQNNLSHQSQQIIPGGLPEGLLNPLCGWELEQEFYLHSPGTHIERDQNRISF